MLVLEYDGTNYHGFQRQAGRLTIQEVLEESLAKITKEDGIRVIGAGRTDAGVHAEGQVVNFKTHARMEAERFVPALNSILPGDIRVKASREVSPEFHARFDATSKTYRYVIQTGAYLSPFIRNFAHHVPYSLDVEAMERASRHLVGCHDFRAFCASGGEVKSFTRSIYRIDWAKQINLVMMTVEANGFLYNMVRIIVGTLLEVGRGKLEEADVLRILESRERPLAGPTAPAKGLTLVAVSYGGQPATLTGPSACIRIPLWNGM